MNATMMLVGLATVGAALPAAGAPAAQAQVDRVAANPSRAGRRLLLEAAKLSVRNQPLKVALQLLGRTSGVPLNYSDYFLPDDLRVSCDCLEVSVGAALERLLASTMLRVVEMKSHVLIEPIDERSRPAPVLALHAAVVVDSPSAFDGAVPPMSDPPQAPVTGTVRDAQTERALPGARLTVVGTSLSATTDAAGRYTIDGVQPGTHRVRAILIGYGAAEQSVTVRAGASTVLDFGLRPLPFQLSEIVTTATGQQNRLELGNTVSTIDAAATVAESPVVSVQDLLNSRATGVSVLSDNGVLGGGHRIRVRGLSSASLSNDPLVYLDGVRIEASAPAPAGGTGGPASLGGPRISLLNDINPEEIESIEVVKGPSAATLYGTEAANGVIRITTKRGLDGRPRWSLYLEQGLSDDVTDYPDAFWSTGPQGRCVPFQQALGLCTIDNVATVNLTKDPQFRPFRTGHRQQYGAQVSGGVSGLRYFLSGEFENESGTLTMPRAEVDRLKAERGVAEIPDDQRNPSELTRASVRGNLSLPLGDDASVTISNGLIRSAVRNPPLGDRVENPLIATVTGVNPNPAASTPYRFVPPSQAFAQRLERNTDRFVNSIQASWTPFEKL
ncbi:MAG: TonB-dependent receptor plug domain-containing protein [Gemmatimonadales bacterium]